MRYALLLLLLLSAACTTGIADSEEPVETEETVDTEETEEPEPWEATFWILQGGVWVEHLETLDAKAGGLDLASGQAWVGAGTWVSRWTGEDWEPGIDTEAPGPIDAYTNNGSGNYVAVGERLFSWVNPGVWARWLEPAPGDVSAIAYLGYTRVVAVGSQLFYFSSDDVWTPYGVAAPADIECVLYIPGTKKKDPVTMVMAGGAIYTWTAEGTWAPADYPESPFPLVGGCTLGGEGTLYLVTNRMVE